MMDREMLQDAVDSKFEPVYATSYDQVKDALQDKHGQRGWIGALAQALSGSDSKSGKPYLAARRSIERYEKGQFKEMKKRSPEMTRVGKSLPPIGRKAPESMTVTVTGVQYDKGYPQGRTRVWTATFTGSESIRFAHDPNYYTFFGKIGYPKKIVDGFDSEDSSSVDVIKVA